MMIIYDTNIRWSCMMIIYDDHIWWSYMMIIYDDHKWWSYMMKRLTGNRKNYFVTELFGDVWDMFWHHDWCLKNDLDLPAINFLIKQKWIGLKRRRIIVRSFSTTQIIQQSHLDPSYEHVYFGYLYSWRWVLSKGLFKVPAKKSHPQCIVAR
jgi:hypothetical protein